MSTVKISELPLLTQLNANTANSLFVGVDIPSGVTGKFTAHTLAQGLYSNEILNVGGNPLLFTNTISQFAAFDSSFLQINLQNITGSGSSDFVATANIGTQANNYIDMGINGSTFSDPNFSSMKSLDGYLYVHGSSDYSSDGNLVVGTASKGANVSIIIGGTKSSNVVATFGNNSTYFYKDVFTGNVTVTGNFILSDGSVAASNTYMQANDLTTLTLSRTYTDTANTFLKANDALTLSSAKSYTDTANTFLQSNIASTLTLSKNYTDTTNNFIQSNYLANTTGRFNGSLTITGNLTANTFGTTVSYDNISSNNAVFSKNITVLGSITANTSLGNVFFSNITTITTQANTLQFFSQSSSNPPPQTSGQIWYNGDIQSLTNDTDIAGDRPGIGRVLYERVYNQTGATIPAGSVVRLQGNVTSNNIPWVTLADATTAANSLASGYVKNAIANGAYGYTYSSGIVEGCNTSMYTTGDILFLTATPGAGTMANTAPLDHANASIQIAKVVSSNATSGKLRVQIIDRPAYGKANGSVVYANNNILVATQMLFLNDDLRTVNIAGSISAVGSIALTGSITMNNSTFAANSAAVNIIASANGATQAPIADGTLLQLTGKDGYNAKVILDSAGASNSTYALFNGRSMRGTAQNPTATQAGDTIVRFGGNGYGATGFGSGVGSGGAKMDYVALENYTDTQKGTQIILATTPVGSNALTTVVTYAANAINYAQNTSLFIANTIHYNANYNNTTVTQLTNKSTAVYANGRTGQITTSGANLNKGAAVSFTVYNTYVTSAKDVIIINIASGASVNYDVSVNAVSPGSFVVVIDNCDGTPSGSNAADTLILNFAIINVT